MENARTWRGCKGGQSEKPPQVPAPPTANAPCKGDTAEEEDPSSWDYSALPGRSLAQRQELSQLGTDGKRKGETRPCKHQNGSSQCPALLQSPGTDLQPSAPPAHSRSCLAPARGPSYSNKPGGEAMPFTHETWSQPASPASLTDGEAGQHHALTVPQPRSRPSISRKQKTFHCLEAISKAKKPKDAPTSEASHPKQGCKVERQHASCSCTGGRDDMGSQAGQH